MNKGSYLIGGSGNRSDPQSSILASKLQSLSMNPTMNQSFTPFTIPPPCQFSFRTPNYFYPPQHNYPYKPTQTRVLHTQHRGSNQQRKDISFNDTLMSPTIADGQKHVSFDESVVSPSSNGYIPKSPSIGAHKIPPSTLPKPLVAAPRVAATPSSLIVQQPPLHQQQQSNQSFYEESFQTTTTTTRTTQQGSEIPQLAPTHGQTTLLHKPAFVPDRNLSPAPFGEPRRSPSPLRHVNAPRMAPGHMTMSKAPPPAPPFIVKPTPAPPSNLGPAPPSYLGPAAPSSHFRPAPPSNFGPAPPSSRGPPPLGTFASMENYELSPVVKETQRAASPREPILLENGELIPSDTKVSVKDQNAWYKQMSKTIHGLKGDMPMNRAVPWGQP